MTCSFASLTAATKATAASSGLCVKFRSKAALSRVNTKSGHSSPCSETQKKRNLKTDFNVTFPIPLFKGTHFALTARSGQPPVSSSELDRKTVFEV